MANSAWKIPSLDDEVVLAKPGDTISLTDADGNVKESYEVVAVRPGDEIQPGTSVIEVKGVKS